MKRALIILLTLISIAVSATINNRFYKEIPVDATEKDGVSYIPLTYGFANVNSAWGSIGITDKGLIHVVTCDHMTDAAVYEYNTKNSKLFFMGRMENHFHNRFYSQRQPKVHTPLFQYNKDGLVYFGTDAGDESEGALYGHFDEGYAGGFLAAINPITKEIKSLGQAKKMGGTKALLLDQKNGLLYFPTSPECNLYKYDINNDVLKNLGRINGDRVVRTMFTDKWNNIYASTEIGELIRYNFAKDSIEYLNVKPFDASNTGPSQIAYAPDTSFIIGYNAYTGVISKYYPEKNGAGRVEDLGNLFDANKKVMARSLNYFNGKIYTICTSIEEDSFDKRFRYLLIYDIDQKKEIKRIDLDPRIHQVYGHSITDSKGYIYFCGFWDSGDYGAVVEGQKRCFLIKINTKKI